MRAGDLLRELDQRLLPTLARYLARLDEARPRRQLLTSTALLSSLAVLLTAVWVAERPSVGDPTVGEVTRVGVTEGQSIPGYLRSAGDELTTLLGAPPSTPDAETYALVSLSAYLPPDRLAPLLADLKVSEVFGRVPLPGRQTELVRIPALRIPDDVLAGMVELADRKEQEARDYRARGAAVTGTDEADRTLRDWYDSGAEVAAAEAAAYRSGCACVYAAVVRARPAVLRAVATRPGVRGVDPAPEVRRLDRAVFTPPLPEQDDVARPPVDTGLTAQPTAVPASPGSPSVAASGTSSPTPLVTAPPPTGAPPAPTATATEPLPSPTPTKPGRGPGGGGRPDGEVRRPVWPE